MKTIRIYRATKHRLKRPDDVASVGVELEIVPEIAGGAFSLRTAMAKARKLAGSHRVLIRQGDRRGYRGNEGFFYVQMSEAVEIDASNQHDARYPR